MSQKVFDTLKPIGTFWVAEAKDIEANGESLGNYIPIILTPEEYNALLDGEEVEYEGEKITFDEEKIYLIKLIPTDPNPIDKT